MTVWKLTWLIAHQLACEFLSSACSPSRCGCWFWGGLYGRLFPKPITKETTNSFPSPRADFVSFTSLQKPLSFTSACLSWFPWGCCSWPDTPARPRSRLRKQMVTVLYLGELLVMSQCPNFSSGKKKAVVRTLKITWVSAVRLRGGKWRCKCTLEKLVAALPTPL